MRKTERERERERKERRFLLPVARGDSIVRDTWNRRNEIHQVPHYLIFEAGQFSVILLYNCRILVLVPFPLSRY